MHRRNAKALAERRAREDEEAKKRASGAKGEREL
jgi:hypothetical protein